ncbi:MAG: penicillin-binding transpeptidase domain-containing protein, partial [Planctomycetota bacterium]
VQLLRLACGLARRSSLPALRIFAEENGKMNARDGADDRAVNPAIAPRHWDLVVRGMRGAVERGTAHRQEIGLTRFDCAVKTGTATVGPSDRNENIACLIGFAPFEEPRVAFVVILERVAGHGGEECGPVAAALLDWLAGERDLPLRRGAGKGAR